MHLIALSCSSSCRFKVASRIGEDFAGNTFGLNGDGAFEGFDFNCWTGGPAGMAVTHVLGLTGRKTFYERHYRHFIVWHPLLMIFQSQRVESTETHYVTRGGGVQPLMCFAHTQQRAATAQSFYA